MGRGYLLTPDLLVKFGREITRSVACFLKWFCMPHRIVDLITKNASALSSNIFNGLIYRAGIKAVGIRVVGCTTTKLASLYAICLSSSFSNKSLTSINCWLLGIYLISPSCIQVKHNYIIMLGKQNCKRHTYMPEPTTVIFVLSNKLIPLI